VLHGAASVEDGADALQHVGVADVGHEAHAPLVDARDGNAVAHQVASGREHGAVAADDDGELGAAADGVVADAARADVRAGLALDQHLAAAALEERLQRPQRLGDLGTAQLADQRDAPEPRRSGGKWHARECTMNHMMGKRAQVLLKTLIERYIAEGQPVGSRTLSKYSGLDLSPATIRNVMADLEDLGFISSPHTSAGRVPTPAGYRFFVDTLLVVKQLELERVRE